MRHPRYTTYRDDELIAAVRPLVPPGQNLPDVATLRQQAHGRSARNQDGFSAPMRLIKEHRCMVSYPDGAKGTCCYRRDGPAGICSNTVTSATPRKHNLRRSCRPHSDSYRA